MTRYKIRNYEGIQGRVWDRVYETVEQAAEAIRSAKGWDEVAVSPGHSDVDGDGVEYTAYVVYSTQAECDADCGQMTSQPTIREALRDCRLCGGKGWGDGSALIRRDGNRGSTKCVGCNGSGKVLA